MLISIFSLVIHNSKDGGENTVRDASVDSGEGKKTTPHTMIEQGSNQFGDTRAWNSHVIQGNVHTANFS